MNAFHFLGIALACWALLVTFMGITREGFPQAGGQERIVASISILLVAGTIAAAIITSANEEEEEGHEEAALVLRS